MNATRSSLLERVRDLNDEEGWDEFTRLYRPMLMGYARRRGLSEDEAEEIAQDCLEVIVGRIRDFRRRKSFRGWLRRTAENKIRHHLQRKSRYRRDDFRGAAAPHVDPDRPEQIWERQWNRTHLLYCIAGLKSDFAPHTLQAFDLYVLREWPVEKISAQLGMTANQIYVAKSRVLRRIRERYAETMETLYRNDR